MRKGEIKLYLFADSMIANIENTTKSTKKKKLVFS